MADDDDPCAALYEAALDTDVTELAAGWLIKAQLLLMVAGEDVDAAKAVVNEPAGRDAALAEFESLTDEERLALRQIVGAQWSHLVGAATRQMWHTAGVLGIDPTSLDPKYVALTAAGLISSEVGAAMFEALDDAIKAHKGE